jgi:hypothetical protein
MEETKQPDLSREANKITPVIKEDIFDQKEDESSGVLEESVENLEPILEEINRLSDSIEEKGEEIDVNSKDSSLSENNQQILNELYQKSEIFLKQISERLASYPKNVVESFRDKNVSNKAENLIKRFNKSKAIKKYTRIQSHYSGETTNQDEQEKAKEKALKSFDSIYKSALPLFRTMDGDNWGGSKNRKEVVRNVNDLLQLIQKEGLSIEKYDEAFNIIEIYKKSSILTAKGEDNKIFSSIISNTVSHFYEKDRAIPEDDKMSEICRNDPYLILEYQNKNYNFDLNKKSEFVEKQLDKIIEESKENNRCNLEANKYFEKILRFNPEKYGLDPENKRVIFESFKSDGILNKHFNYLKKNLFFFKEELDNLSETDIDEIIESYSSYDINKENTQLLLSSINLSENNLKKLFEKTENFSWKEEQNKYSKESLLQNLNKSDNQFVSLFKYKQFDLSPENRISLFKDTIRKCYSDNVFAFFAQVLSNFNEVFDEIPEKERDEIMGLLTEKSIRGSIEDIRMLHTLLPEYDVPPKYKELINEMFSKKYSGRDAKALGKIFGGNQEGEKPSQHEEWLLKNKELAPKLEIEFYSDGYMNDFRHMFFEVIEGKKESVDKDFLIRKYAERISELNAEEYIDLFITRKKISMEYSGIFLEKIKNGDSLFSQLETSVRLNQITEEEYKNILVDMVGMSNSSCAEKSLNMCIEKNILNDEERKNLFESYAKNITKLASQNSNINNYIMESLLGNRYDSSNIKDDEKKIFFNKFFKELLNYENLNNKITEITNNNINYFEKGFPDDKDREDFINKLMLSNNNKAISQLLDGYLEIKTRNINPGENNHPILKGVDEEKFDILFNHGLSLKGLSIDNVLINRLESIPKDKQEILFQNLLSKHDILEDSNNKEEIKNFCAAVAYRIEENKQKEEEKTISEENARKISAKIFSSQYINQETFSEFIHYRRGFLLSDKDILNQCVSSIETKGDANTSYSMLRAFKSEEKAILTEEQVKKLSVKVLDKWNVDEEIYRMHLDSKKDNLQFYLDQELLDKRVERMSESHTDINTGTVLGFLVMQKKEKNSDNRDTDHLVLNNEQEEALTRKLLGQQAMNISNFEQIYDLDKKLFVRLMDSIIEKNELPIQSVSKFVFTREEISGTYFGKIVDYYLEKNSNFNSGFDDICNRYSADPVLLKEIKDKVNNLPDIEKRSIYKSKLLQRDLLSQEELKTFYEEIRSEPNVYSQVLLSAEVLGSLVYSDNPEKDNKFKSEKEETQKNIELISSFVKKYPLENKGRTIAVMLFSREYLPERNMDEVIEKVADTLSKYERILDQNKYEGIPSGLRVSIGMEYEITGSTSSGYEELKKRELKSDIVRLSQAAHIGNGKDAVHEIATRPTTNPYLMLLEMQLLNDIEYIDLNFERTPLYQKGARGYHMTIGGEKGLYINANTNFLQNSILAASWGGIHSGEIGKRVSGGRGVTLRGRSANGGNNNVKVFEKATDSVELRSLSIDKMEPFQRAVVTAYNGAIAIQALEKYTNCTSDQIYEFYKSNSTVNNEKDFVGKLKESNLLQSGYDSDEKNMKIIYAWAELTSNIKDALEYHNNEFLSGETTGYLDKDGIWVDTKDFGGTYNRSRFNSVVSSIDSTLSVEEYVNSTKINLNDFFSSFDVELADNLTKINNLYLKPDNKVKNEKGKEISLGGDQTNTISMLEITKLNNENLEYRNDEAYLKGTVFDTMGERREGYYCAQGGSERMLTHACQIALLNFNKKIEAIVNR